MNMSVSLSTPFLPESFNEQPSDGALPAPGENDFSSFLVIPAPQPPAAQRDAPNPPVHIDNGEGFSGGVKPALPSPSDPLKFESGTKSQRDPIREELAQQIKPQYPGPADATGVPAKIEIPHGLNTDDPGRIADVSRKSIFEIVSTSQERKLTSLPAFPWPAKPLDQAQLLSGSKPTGVHAFSNPVETDGIQRPSTVNTEFSIVMPRPQTTPKAFGSILREVRNSDVMEPYPADQLEQGEFQAWKRPGSETVGENKPVDVSQTAVFRPDQNQTLKPPASTDLFADAADKPASIELSTLKPEAEFEVPAEAEVKSIDSFEKLTGPERLTFGGIFSRPGKGDRPYAPGDTSTGSVSTENVFERSMSIAGASDAAEVPAPSRAEAASQVAPAIIELEKFIGQEKNMDSLKMRLSPAELGSVEITLIRNDDGSMSAQLMTETESAQNSLSESLTQLRESLEAAGIQVEAIEIGCKSFSSAGQGDGREGPRMQQNIGNAPGTAAEPGRAAEETGDDNRLLDLQA